MTLPGPPLFLVVFDDFFMGFLDLFMSLLGFQGSYKYFVNLKSWDISLFLSKTRCVLEESLNL